MIVIASLIKLIVGEIAYGLTDVKGDKEHNIPFLVIREATRSEYEKQVKDVNGYMGPASRYADGGYYLVSVD